MILAKYTRLPLGLLMIYVDSAIVLVGLIVCLLYTSDAADERSSVDLGGRRIIKKKNNALRAGLRHIEHQTHTYTRRMFATTDLLSTV